MVDQNTLGKVNQEVLQNRVNSLRNQKEQIRQRMQNPGLYPDSATPNVTLSNLNEYYRPSQAAMNSIDPSIASLFNRDQSSGGDLSENTPNSSSLGLSSAQASGLNTLANVFGNLAGLPSGFSTTVTGMATGNVAGIGKGMANMAMSVNNMNPYGRMGVNAAIDALSGKSLSTVGKNLGLTALSRATPVFGQLMAAYSIANTLSNLFGMTGEDSGNIGTTESTESAGRTGYYADLADLFSSYLGIGQNNISFDQTTLDAARAQMDAQANESGYGSVGGYSNDGGYGYGVSNQSNNLGGYGYSTAPGYGFTTDISDFGTNYGGLGYGGGGDSSTGLGSDPGPSGTGNSGNAGEA